MLGIIKDRELKAYSMIRGEYIRRYALYKDDRPYYLKLERLNELKEEEGVFKR